MTALTNTAVEALLPGDELKDDRVPGLSVRCRATKRSFMLYYRTKTGIPRRPKIGDYGVLSIAMAREVARTMLAKVAAGEDPVADRQAARQEPVLNDLWDRCEREHWCNGKGWDREAKRLYDAHVRSKLGDRRIKSIGYDDIAKLHTDLKDTPVEANHMIAVVSKMLSLAERFGPEGAKWRVLNTNPCTAIQRYPMIKRKRYAKPAEIGVLGPILEREAETDPEGVAFLYILMFSGARPSEIENGVPAQIERLEHDGQVVGVLRLDDGKTGQRDVFLPPQAMHVIDRLPKHRRTLAGNLPRRLWERVRNEAGCADLWARDLRRTFGTVGLSGGVPIGTIGELLGHASVQTTKIYAKLMEGPAHTAAADIAGRMEKMLKPA